MLVRFPDGTRVDITGEFQYWLPNSSSPAILSFTPTGSAIAPFTYTCFSLQEQADIIKKVNEALAAKKDFLDLISIAPIPVPATVLTLTPNTGSINGYEPVLLTIPNGGTLPGSPANAFADNGLVWFATSLCPQIIYRSAVTIAVITPPHAAGVVSIRYQDSRGTCTFTAGTFTYA